MATLPLHEMGRALQLSYVPAQCHDLVQCLDEIIKRTHDCAPIRPGDFMLKRTGRGHPSGIRQEAVLERQLWETWGPNATRIVDFLPGWCRWLQSYQVPLKKAHNDRHWGKIDLVGVAPDSGPVVVELKKGDATDSILRVIVESLAYGIVLQRLWESAESGFKTEWIEAVGPRLGGPVPELPRLKPVRLVGIAPELFWNRTLSERGKPGAMPDGGWSRIGELLGALHRRGFDFAFASQDAGGGIRQILLPGISE